MTELATILLAFQDALNTNELSWAELRIGPVDLNSRENVCFIEPGPNVTYTENNGMRLHAIDIILSAQITATNRTDISGIDETAMAINLILDTIDGSKEVQNSCVSLHPKECIIFYDDKEGLQGMKLEVTYRAVYSRKRNKP